MKRRPMFHYPLFVFLVIILARLTVMLGVTVGQGMAATQISASQEEMEVQRANFEAMLHSAN